MDSRRNDHRRSRCNLSHSEGGRKSKLQPFRSQLRALCKVRCYWKAREQTSPSCRSHCWPRRLGLGLVETCALTLQSRGHAPASRVMPLISNVRHRKGANKNAEYTERFCVRPLGYSGAGCTSRFAGEQRTACGSPSRRTLLHRAFEPRSWS